MESEAAIDAAEMAKSEAEAGPAAITSHKERSVESSKGKMIKGQKKATEKSIKDAEVAATSLN